jgi:hypothetical protein
MASKYYNEDKDKALVLTGNNSKDGRSQRMVSLVPLSMMHILTA